MSRAIICFAKHETGRRAVELLLKLKVPLAMVIVAASESEMPWFARIRQMCAEAKIDFVTTERLSKDQALIERIRKLKPELAFTVMFTQIIPSSVIQNCGLGIINFHPSILPTYRGPHPVNWAIVNGEKEHGVTAHFVSDKVDAGPILLADTFPIRDSDTNITLQTVIDDTVMEQLQRAYELFLQGNLKAMPQDESRASYYPMRGPGDGRIFWRTMDAQQVRNLCRALQAPIYGSFFDHRRARVIVRECRILRGDESRAPGTVVRVENGALEVATRNGNVLVEKLELEGGETVMDWKNLFRPGDHLQ